jgi:hypothetical protein
VEWSRINTHIAKTKKEYGGYLYSETADLDIIVTYVFGEEMGCSIFVSSDATFMEFVCNEWAPVVFETRDSVWNVAGWDGVDTDGNWVGVPVTLFDDDAGTWDLDAFAYYVSGPHRNENYSGVNEGGHAFFLLGPAKLP